MVANMPKRRWLAATIVSLGIVMVHGLAIVVLGLGITTVAVHGSSKPYRAAPVILQRLPEGGIQPQAAVDSKGTVHVIFFKGKPAAGDLYYYRYAVTVGPGSASAPIRVNSSPSTAIAMGTIRTEQISIGKDNRLHVVWNGISPKDSKGHSPMYMAYTRLNDSGIAFEPQRNLCQWTGNLDGGGSVGADRSGNVYATWHTDPPNNKAGEEGRGVFLAVSRDNGATFSREKLINPDPTGACACCSMRTFVDSAGRVRVLYRTASKGGSQRDTMLLTSTDKGNTFSLRNIDPWPLNACPMSSMSLAEDEGKLFAAWETREKVYWSPLAADGRLESTPIVAPGIDKSKHPIIVSNGKGQVLFAWTEGTGWQRGGSLSWQTYTSAGSPVGVRGHAEGVPIWSLLSGYSRPDGAFVVLY